MKHYLALKNHFQKLSHLLYMQRILMWDEAVIMPEGAGSSRGQALATLNQIIQKKLTSKKISNLISAAKNELLSSPWDCANLAWMDKKTISATCIPVQLVANSTKATLSAFQAWRKYRDENNWHDFKPYLEKSFQYIYEIAERKSQVFQLHRYETLMDQFTPGLTQEKVDSVFSNLNNHLPALRNLIIEKQKNETVEPIIGHFPIQKQKEIGLSLMRKMHFDFNHGRLDISHHPFCDGIPTDIRITTHFDETNCLSSLFGIIHEVGHALYEQGMPKEWIFQPVGQTQCKSLHESQSLIFEYEVGYSSSFLHYLSQEMNCVFGFRKEFSTENLTKAMTRIKTNLIRIDADEVSYPLHVFIRHEIEKLLFQKEINIDDLPAIWDEFMLKYFNASTKGNYKEGVMQDMHWSWGYWGYFPSYVFGRLMASQLYFTFQKTHPDFENKLKSGDFSLLHQWLQKNIYSHASMMTSDDLLLHVTQEPLNPKYFLNEITKRYLLKNDRASDG